MSLVILHNTEKHMAMNQKICALHLYTESAEILSNTLNEDWQNVPLNTDLEK